MSLDTAEAAALLIGIYGLIVTGFFALLIYDVPRRLSRRKFRKDLERGRRRYKEKAAYRDYLEQMESGTSDPPNLEPRAAQVFKLSDYRPRNATLH